MRTPPFLALLLPLLAQTLLAASAHAAPPAPVDAGLGTSRVLEQALNAKPPTLCAVLQASDEAQRQFGAIAQKSWEGAMSSRQPGAFDPLKQALASTRTRYPTVALAIGAETVYHEIEFASIARLFNDDAAAPLLRDAADLWPAGVPTYFTQITDIEVCSRPQVLTEALSRWQPAWPAVSACARRFLAVRVAHAVTELRRITPCEPTSPLEWEVLETLQQRMRR